MKEKLTNSILLLLLVSNALFYGCKNDSKKTNRYENQKTNENIYKDVTLQTIYNLQDDRNTKQLVTYLKNENPEYRKAAVIAFASVQDTTAIQQIAELMKDENESVRYAVAYTLGQIRHKFAENSLIDFYQKEKSVSVKSNILEAIGKCGTEKGLIFITDLHISINDTALITGQAWGLTRFALKNTVSEKSTKKAIEILTTQNINAKTKFAISCYFARNRNIDLSASFKNFIDLFKTETDLFTKINLVSSLGRAKKQEIKEFLCEILKNEHDYRIKTNTIDALRKYDYAEINELLFEQLLAKNVNLSIKASEYFLEKGITKDAEKYFETAKKITNWRARTNMIAAGLKYAENKTDISNQIISGYQATENIYEKASLLKALAGDVMNYKFIESQIFSAKEFVFKSYGMEALSEIRKNTKFDEVAKKIAQKGDNLYDEFVLIIKKAIESGDAAMISIAAEIIREPKFNYKNIFKNIAFLTDALKKCKLPQDIEAYIELQNTISYLTGKDAPQLPKPSKNSIDWKLITSISPNQRVLIKTSKGDITLQLLVNESPASVANFVNLVKQGYYKNGAIHRVVPNFVIQDGCPRGDGWGGPGFTIRSEFNQLYYQEGSVGMASAGKDTESSQWFITHSPTPHLDGRYTIFAMVVEGMKTVHHIEIGDKIISMELI